MALLAWNRWLRLSTNAWISNQLVNSWLLFGQDALRHHLCLFYLLQKVMRLSEAFDKRWVFLRCLFSYWRDSILTHRVEVIRTLYAFSWIEIAKRLRCNVGLLSRHNWVSTSWERVRLRQVILLLQLEICETAGSLIVVIGLDVVHQPFVLIIYLLLNLLSTRVS
jgi:hypothetical protein